MEDSVYLIEEIELDDWTHWKRILRKDIDIEIYIDIDFFGGKAKKTLHFFAFQNRSWLN